MKIKTLLTVVLVSIATILSAKDTTYVKVMNEYVGVAIGNDYYPLKGVSRYTTNTIVNGYGYVLNKTNGDINVIIKEKNIELRRLKKEKNDELRRLRNEKINKLYEENGDLVMDKNFYLRTGGKLKNLSHAIAISGGIVVGTSTNESSSGGSLTQLNQQLESQKKLTRDLIIVGAVALTIDAIGNYCISMSGTVD